LASWVLQAQAGTSCASLTALTASGITIQSAAEVAAGSFIAPGVQAPLRFCRVVATAAPSSDSDIHFEVWIPLVEHWNGKLLGTGNGGFAGAIAYRPMADALARGYASVSSDTGHSGDQMEFGQGHPEKIEDWAYRSVHIMTAAAKLIIRDHAGRFPDRSYFQGCSTGGQQALSEAQRFPGDYDGIIAGDPGNDRVRLIIGFLWSWIATHAPDGKPLLSSSQLSILTRAAIAKCDPRDGLRDGLIDDPLGCDFDPATLACAVSSSDSCFTEEQIAAVRRVYGGAKNPRTGEQIFPGWPRGSEEGWGAYILNPTEPVRLGLFKYFAFADPNWDWRTFDWDRDVDYIEAKLPHLSAVSRDLNAFRSQGGKLIMYTGKADPVVPAQDIAAYYDAVAHTMGGFGKARQFFRFFMAPGMGHCGGGAGPNTFDTLSALENWVERGRPPEQLVAAHLSNGQVDRTRPLCVYPNVARYRGIGSIDSAENFTCAMLKK